MIKNRTLSGMLALFFIVLISGCSSLLPSGEVITRSPWKSFEQGKQAFDKVIPYQTTETQLKELGFDPFNTPNITILTYLDVVRLFKYKDTEKNSVPEGIRDCIQATKDCKAYEVEVTSVQSERQGNFFVDFFNFKRKTKETGWQFTALIIMRNETVVYKLWGGKPRVNEFREQRNPLGPLQGLGNIGGSMLRQSF
ncbi:MAG: hypothetical protein HQL54_12795 [Magnetococcales bacterium]|nr:hypothetical protein [Magnetococcales bacterium]